MKRDFEFGRTRKRRSWNKNENNKVDDLIIKKKIIFEGGKKENNAECFIRGSSSFHSSVI